MARLLYFVLAVNCLGELLEERDASLPNVHCVLLAVVRFSNASSDANMLLEKCSSYL